MERNDDMRKEDIVRKYFQAWLDKDIEPLKSIFSNDITYSECYGPEYHGLVQILKWFTDWNDKMGNQKIYSSGYVHGCRMVF